MNLGIDIGNTTALAAHIDHNDLPVLIRDCHLAEENVFMTKSKILFTDSNFAYIGSPLEKLLKYNPLLDTAEDFYLQLFSPKIITRKGIGREWKVEHLIALLLKKIKIDVKSSLGADPENCVLAVPPACPIEIEKQLKNAFEMCGLPLVKLLSFPEAVILGYSKVLINSNCSLVIDFGPTFFQMSLLEVKDEKIELIAFSQPKIGLGNQLIQSMSNLICTKVKKNQPNSRIASEKTKTQLEKIVLRMFNFFSFSMNSHFFYDLCIIGNESYHILISRKEFIALVQPIVEEIKAELWSFLKTNGREQIENIYFSGGCCNLINFQELLKSDFNTATFFCKNPNEVIVKGAAIFVEKLTKNKFRSTVKNNSTPKIEVSVKPRTAKSAKRVIEVKLNKKSTEAELNVNQDMEYSVNLGKRKIDKTIVNNIL